MNISFYYKRDKRAGNLIVYSDRYIVHYIYPTFQQSNKLYDNNDKIAFCKYRATVVE